MAGRDRHGHSPSRGPLAVPAVAAFAVLCCAGAPLIAALAGGIAVGTLLGAGAAIAVAVLLGLLVGPRIRRPRIHEGGGGSNRVSEHEERSHG